MADAATPPTLPPEQARKIRHAAEILEQFVAVSGMLGFDRGTIVSATGEVLARFLGRIAAENGNLEELLAIFDQALRARIALVIEEVKAATLARDVEAAKHATKH